MAHQIRSLPRVHDTAVPEHLCLDLAQYIKAYAHFNDYSTQNVVAAQQLILFIGDPEEGFGISESILQGLFGFTPSEAAVAAILANGLSVQDAVEKLDVSITTVRAHVRAIFNKTGVSRQSELVHLIHTTIPNSS